MWGSTIPTVYYGFYCDPPLQKLYCTMVCCFSKSTVIDHFIASGLHLTPLIIDIVTRGNLRNNNSSSEISSPFTPSLSSSDVCLSRAVGHRFHHTWSGPLWVANTSKKDEPWSHGLNGFAEFDWSIHLWCSGTWVAIEECYVQSWYLDRFLRNGIHGNLTSWVGVTRFFTLWLFLQVWLTWTGYCGHFDIRIRPTLFVGRVVDIFLSPGCEIVQGLVLRTLIRENYARQKGFRLELSNGQPRCARQNNCCKPPTDVWCGRVGISASRILPKIPGACPA